MDDRSPEVLSVAILFLVTSWIIVGVRVYVRAGMLKTFGSDDWAMVVTLVSAIKLSRDQMLLYQSVMQSG